jgi:hypothetical protein
MTIKNPAHFSKETAKAVKIIKAVKIGNLKAIFGLFEIFYCCKDLKCGKFFPSNRTLGHCKMSYFRDRFCIK